MVEPLPPSLGFPAAVPVQKPSGGRLEVVWRSSWGCAGVVQAGVDLDFYPTGFLMSGVHGSRFSRFSDGVQGFAPEFEGVLREVERFLAEFEGFLANLSKTLQLRTKTLDIRTKTLKTG